MKNYLIIDQDRIKIENEARIFLLVDLQTLLL